MFHIFALAITHCAFSFSHLFFFLLELFFFFYAHQVMCFFFNFAFDMCKLFLLHFNFFCKYVFEHLYFPHLYSNVLISINIQCFTCIFISTFHLCLHHKFCYLHLFFYFAYTSQLLHIYYFSIFVFFLIFVYFCSFANFLMCVGFLLLVFVSLFL